MTEVAAGVHVVQTSTADGKIGVVLGGTSALAVDAGIDAEEGARLVAEIESAGSRADRLVFTHGHVDHVLGSTAFPDADVISTAATRDHIERQLDSFAERAGVAPSALADSLAFPSTIVPETGEVEFDIGGRVVVVAATPGHAPGAVCVFIPDADVLFGGDTVVTGIPPTFKDGSSAALERTLRVLAGRRIETLVPGHGPIVHGASATRTIILWAADYLARCRELILSRPDAGLDELLVEGPFEQLIGTQLPADQHHMVWRHEQTFVNLLAERERGRLLD